MFALVYLPPSARFFRFVGLLLLLVAPLCANSPAAELPVEAHARSGLPHLSAKLSAPGSEIRVAFLGGSITAADGWRRGIFEHLKQTYPNNTFTEIFAAIPGTGSDFGVARLRGDVLAHKPDLLFVEFAVNDTDQSPATVRFAIEGLVRQTRTLSPQTDLCFVYTLSHAGKPYLEDGVYPPPAAAMEAVATHYSVPTLHFGVEVVRRLRAGTLVFSGEAPSDKVPVFTKDQVHPGAEGHKIYTATLTRHLGEFLAASDATPSPPLPAPLDPLNWESACVVPVAQIAAGSAKWTPVEPGDVRLSALRPELRRATMTARTPGVVMEFDFEGTAVGFYGIKGPDAGRFHVTVDNLPPVEGVLFDSLCTAGRYRAKPWFFPKPLASGRHHVRVELLDSGPDKTAVRAKSKVDDPAFDLKALTLSGVIVVGSLVL